MSHKTRYTAKLPIALIVFMSLLLSQIACAESYISMQDLTATQHALQPTTPTPTNTQQATQQPSPSPSHTLTNGHSSLVIPPAVSQTPKAQNTPSPQHTASPTQTHTPIPGVTEKPPIMYYAQTGDSLNALAKRFGVTVEEIVSDDPIPKHGFINPGQVLVFPDRLTGIGPSDIIFPDSEIIYSPSSISFDTNTFVDEANGYLKTYRQYLPSGWHSGAEIIQIVAQDNSINPRLLLALLEYQSHWVYSEPTNIAETEYPLGWIDLNEKGLYRQLVWVVQQLSQGYYGWRVGSHLTLNFPNEGSLRIAPELNAGTVALQHLFSQLYPARSWFGVFYEDDGFLALYQEMFGSPWEHAEKMGPLFPADFSQPPMVLPFAPGHTWNFTGGPHFVWGADSPKAALDFAPVGIIDCTESTEWVTASIGGLVIRSENGLIMVDMDGDGYTQTGWVLMYMHIEPKNSVTTGTFINTNDLIGHPSCVGGFATGTHVHVARKYNGEWMLAGGPIPYVLNGWEAHDGGNIYEGTLSKDDQIIQANPYSSFETSITRPKNEENE